VTLVHLLSDLPEAIALRFETHHQLYRPLLLGDGFENPSAAGHRDASATNGARLRSCDVKHETDV